MVDLWPLLETERTELRRITDQDLSFILGHFSDADVCRYMVDAEPPGSAEEAQKIINTASYRMLRKQGFVAEGVIRDKHLFRGEYYDHYLLALLKRDFHLRNSVT